MRTGRLLLASCDEEGGSQPVGFALPRFADCFPDLCQFIWAESHAYEFGQGFAPGLFWSANFPSHSKIIAVTRKLYLQDYNLCVTIIQVSNGTVLSSEEVAGTAAGESELTNSQPVEAGASRRESEMNAEALQVRSLKIEHAGDFFYGRVVPRIRISGQWLERAGFKPGNRVELVIEQPGTIRLRFVGEAKGAKL